LTRQLYITKHLKCGISFQARRIIVCQENDRDILSREPDSFKVTLENIIVCRCNDLLNAMLGLVMAIYVFNLAYPKNFEKTFLISKVLF